MLCLTVLEPQCAKERSLIGKFSCSFRKTFRLSLIFDFNNNIVFCFLSQICNLARVMTFSKNNFRYDLE